MGIDRIGKGAPPASPSTEAPQAATRKDGTFSLDRTGSSMPTEGTTRAEGPSSALAKLRAGEIDVEGYVTLRIEDATRGLSGLSPSELADIRSMLRDEIATDPSLTELFRLTTGTTPSFPEE